MDQHAHAGHEEDHGHRERVDVEVHVDLELVDGDPGPQILGEGPHRCMHGEEIEVDTDRHGEGGGDEAGGDGSRRRVAEPPAEEDLDGEADQGQQDDQPCHVQHRPLSPS